MNWVFFVTMLGCVHVACGYNFTVTKSCLGMFPSGQFTLPQMFSKPPYTIVPSSTEYTPKIPMTVVVRGKQGETLQNVMLGTRRKCTGFFCIPKVFPNGEFDPSVENKLLNCNNAAGSAVATPDTTENRDMNKFEVTWRTNDVTLTSDLEFVASVVHNQTVWWMNIGSPVIKRSNLPVPTDPAPVPTTPVPTKPAPVPTEPVITKPVPAPTAPVITEPAPVVTEPVITEPAPVVTEPAPVVTEPVITEPAPVVTEPVITEPAPVITEPAPVVTEPVITEPVPVVTEPVPVPSESPSEIPPGGSDGGSTGCGMRMSLRGQVRSGSTIPGCPHHHVMLAIGVQMLWCLVVQLKQ